MNPPALKLYFLNKKGTRSGSGVRSPCASLDGNRVCSAAERHVWTWWCSVWRRRAERQKTQRDRMTWRDATLTVTCQPSPAEAEVSEVSQSALNSDASTEPESATLSNSLGAALNYDQVRSPEKALTGKPAMARLPAPAHTTPTRSHELNSLGLCDQTWLEGIKNRNVLKLHQREEEEESRQVGAGREKKRPPQRDKAAN